MDQLNDQYQSAHLCIVNAPKLDPPNFEHRVDLIHLSEVTHDAVSRIKEDLVRLDWKAVEHFAPYQSLQPGKVALVIDELYQPIMTDINSNQWSSLHALLGTGAKIVWVTAGSQFRVTNPTGSLIHGLARTVRAEDPTISLTTLDVESSLGPKTSWAIDAVLKSVHNPPPKKRIDSEYVERNGIIYVSRILPDDPVNLAEKEDNDGAEPISMPLHKSPNTIRYRCERVGTLDSLRYTEVSASELHLPANCVEVELYAAGLNFKVSTKIWSQWKDASH